MYKNPMYGKTKKHVFRRELIEEAVSIHSVTNWFG